MKFDLLDKIELEFISCTESEYTDLFGTLQNELIMIFKIKNRSINNKITIFSNPYFLYAQNDTLKIRIPLYHKEMKKYFSNYKDYYYLPYEDMCILKSIGGAVDSDYKENAKKETCYIKHSGFFFPSIDYNPSLFKLDYNTKKSYILYDKTQIDQLFLSDYAKELIEKINN